jgi:hypothetical protein
MSTALDLSKLWFFNFPIKITPKFEEFVNKVFKKLVKPVAKGFRECKYWL